MTVLHVPLLPAVVRTTGPLLSFPSHAALGELGTPAATHRAKTQAPQTEGQPPGQTLLGARAPVLVLSFAEMPSSLKPFAISNIL